jgi:hypothetical protein
MSTTKHSIVMDECLTKSRRTKQKKQYSNERLEENILQQQRIKEKQLLKQWKAARAVEKKTQLIMRTQSRDVRRCDKERFSENDETEYDTCGQVIDRAVWKHAGCRKECEADDCNQWQLDYLNSYESYYMV